MAGFSYVISTFLDSLQYRPSEASLGAEVTSWLLSCRQRLPILELLVRSRKMEQQGRKELMIWRQGTQRAAAGRGPGLKAETRQELAAMKGS